MKKIAMVLSLGLLLASCSQGPKDVAIKFTENVAKGKIDEAKKYATEPTGKLLEMAVSFGGLPVEPDTKIEFVKDSIVDSKAWVTVKNQKGKESEVTLVKMDGKWLVNMEPQK
ncbi:DUF4878 domain-containing protein [Myroides odoratus]|uniref:DUF4878 domain-containing protein n=1 Tax=Myroides odoratus TaxID=256 RepID=UPI0007658D74|nr:MULTISPECIES: DUF4878 domain-containing protein [Myroides]WHT39738.1 DUF4878 domain-containing protein [Myroides sp. mNGS23_01]